MKPWLLLIFCLWVPVTSAADPFTVAVLDTQYSTAVRIQTSGGEVPALLTSRQGTSKAPTTDVMMLAGVEWAYAAADLFEVHARTMVWDPEYVYHGRSWGNAESLLTFAPLSDGMATLEFSLSGLSQVWYSNGGIRLQDLTTQDVLWDYGWTCCFFSDSTMPWTTPPDYNGGTAFTIDQRFDATHQYALTLAIGTEALNDREGLSMRVSGMKTVPEPSTILLVGTGLVAAGVRRWRRQTMRRL